MTLPLVLLHGFSGSGESWSAVRYRLAPEREIVAPSLVGHGGHEAVRVTDFESEVDRIAGQLAAKSHAYDLAGYSLGGRVALGLLVRHPDLFRSATLIGAHAGLESEEERAERRNADEHLCQILERLGISAFVAKWESIPLFASQKGLPPEVLEGQRRARLLHDPNELARSLRLTGLGMMPSYWGALPSIRIPTTFVAGSLDEKFVKLARRMAELVPEAALEIVPNAGHNVALETPAALAGILSKRLGHHE